MKKIQQNIQFLKWLHYAGVGYYYSTKKDSKHFSSDFLDTNILHDSSKQPKNILMNDTPCAPVSVPKEQPAKQIACPIRTLANKANNVKELYDIVNTFDGCDLKQFAQNTVFNDGQINAPILVIGEAPGATEDKEGIPFCGESGKLLDSMLKTIGIDRAKNAYITNTVFWRPPANRRPTSEEIEICRPFVEKHIALAKPKLIILVGSTATTSLLGKKESISFIRQNLYDYTNQYLETPIPTTALFHPAYLLRQPIQKKATWFDLLKISELIKQLNIKL